MVNFSAISLFWSCYSSSSSLSLEVLADYAVWQPAPFIHVEMVMLCDTHHPSSMFRWSCCVTAITWHPHLAGHAVWHLSPDIHIFSRLPIFSLLPSPDLPVDFGGIISVSVTCRIVWQTTWQKQGGLIYVHYVHVCNILCSYPPPSLLPCSFFNLFLLFFFLN